MKPRRIGVVIAILVLGASIGLGATLAGSQPSDAPPSRADLVSLDPFPESERHDAARLEAELERRLEVWSASTLPESLTAPQLGDALLTIWHAMGELPESEEWWLQTKQLGARVHLICERLPADDPLRADFCPSQATT
jgi:hypothetical protein